LLLWCNYITNCALSKHDCPDLHFWYQPGLYILFLTPQREKEQESSSLTHSISSLTSNLTKLSCSDLLVHIY